MTSDVTGVLSITTPFNTGFFKNHQFGKRFTKADCSKHGITLNYVHVEEFANETKGEKVEREHCQPSQSVQKKYKMKHQEEMKEEKVEREHPLSAKSFSSEVEGVEET